MVLSDVLTFSACFDMSRNWNGVLPTKTGCNMGKCLRFLIIINTIPRWISVYDNRLFVDRNCFSFYAYCWHVPIYFCHTVFRTSKSKCLLAQQYATCLTSIHNIHKYNRNTHTNTKRRKNCPVCYPTGPCVWPNIHLCTTLIARFICTIWGPSGADRTQVGPMLASCTLLSGAWT